ncbi:hypothetical protein [Hymenobacter fastidiosus]|uniref:hypothetical protein n=1 Tax=Hymenobacter fastidiosus TaxID=486264 RepID=UPI0031ED5FAF
MQVVDGLHILRGKALCTIEQNLKPANLSTGSTNQDMEVTPDRYEQEQQAKQQFADAMAEFRAASKQKLGLPTPLEAV